VKHCWIGGLPLALCVALLLQVAEAQETPWTNQDAMSEASSEAAQCEAYYAFTQKCAENSGDTELSKGASLAGETARMSQFKTGQAAGMTIDAMTATLKMALDAAQAATQSSCVNLPALNKFTEPCKSFLENPVERIQTLILGPPGAAGQGNWP
jgi:hypothetical protein